MIPGLGRSPVEGMATLSSVLAWGIPWTEEPGGLQSRESQRVRHDLATSLSFLSFFSVIVLIGSDVEGNCMPIAAAKSLQLCPTLCNPIDGSQPGSFLPRELHKQRSLTNYSPRDRKETAATE